MKTKKLITLMLALLLVLAALPWQGALAAGTRYYVKPGGDDSKDGLSWENAKANLKAVMDAANSGDEIWVAKGTYSPGGDPADTFRLKRGVKVYGGFAGNEGSPNERDLGNAANKTTLDGGGNVYHVVTGGTTATPANTRLDGFTITGGNANGSGDDAHGGGMYNYNSSPTVANCVFSANTANDDGGGMYNFYSSSPVVENCVFSDNTANRNGGGMYNYNSSPAVENCAFTDNTANGGGGMYNFDSSSPAVTDCAFSGNTANLFGGGMYNNNSSPAVTNCTFSGNTAHINGGGMGNVNAANPTLINCTFSGNTAKKGGGMYNIASSGPTAANTILWGNTAANEDSGADIYQSGSTLTLKNCVVGKYTLNGATISGTPITGDPKLSGYTANLEATGDPKQVYIYKLGSGSSAIDKGLSVGTNINGVQVPNTDQLGTARPKGAGVDIGAFESSAAAVPVTGVSLNKTATSLVVGGSETLQATVEPATATNQTVTWSSDKPAIATVDNGVVTAVAPGTATIKVKTQDGNYEAACTVAVSATAVPVTGVKLNKTATSLTVGGSETLQATIEPATATNQNVTWSSDKPAIATVNNGVVKAVAPGTTKITVTTVDGNKTATCTVTVQAAGTNYTTLFGDNQTYTRGSGSTLEMIIKRNIEDQKTFGLFRQLMMDGALVSESNYTKAGGSLIIRLKSAWLDTLAAGLHRLSFIFEDGVANATLTIVAKPGSFEDVAVPSNSFTFTKLWKGGEESSIDWTLYDQMGSVASKLFNKKVVSPTEWRYEAYFSGPVVRYLVEKPVAGYQTRYRNVGVYAGITDRCCNGGTIINEKIPPTGDKADLALWAGLALLGLVGIGAVLIADRRRKKNK